MHSEYWAEKLKERNNFKDMWKDNIKMDHVAGCCEPPGCIEGGGYPDWLSCGELVVGCRERRRGMNRADGADISCACQDRQQCRTLPLFVIICWGGDV
jgi:hypothetical protein